MENVGIFATQMRSEWYQNMLRQAENDLGHKDQPWSTRAMVAFGPAGLEGQKLTTREIRDGIADFVGFPETRHSMNCVARRAIGRGIMKKTGRRKYVKGSRNRQPEYEIVGHVEIDPRSGDLISVRVCGE